MKVLLSVVVALVAVSCVAAVSIQSRELPPDLIDNPDDWLTQENLECLIEAIEVAGRIDIEFVDWAHQLTLTIISLVRRRQECLDMLGDRDPPRPWEVAASEACLVGWRLSVAAELTRFLRDMRAGVAQAQKFIDAITVGFTECRDN